VAETKYETKTYGEFNDILENKNKVLSSPFDEKDDTSPNRYDDKTEEEMVEEMNRKRKKQFNKLIKFRYYQAGGMLGAIIFYVLIYRRWLTAQPVLNSVVYKMSIDFIKANKIVKNKIGVNF